MKSDPSLQETPSTGKTHLRLWIHSSSSVRATSKVHALLRVRLRKRPHSNRVTFQSFFRSNQSYISRPHSPSSILSSPFPGTPGPILQSSTKTTVTPHDQIEVSRRPRSDVLCPDPSHSRPRSDGQPANTSRSESDPAIVAPPLLDISPTKNLNDHLTWTVYFPSFLSCH